MESLAAPLLLLATATGAIYYVLTPFLGEKLALTGEGNEGEKTALELRKVNLYQQIREAEFEHEMGLTTEKDFARTRSDLVAEATIVVRQLAQNDEVAEPVTFAAPSCPACNSPLEAEARFCSHCGSRTDGYCPACTAEVAAGDRFCGHCGRGLLA